MQNRYSTYSAQDFLQDEKFLNWQIFPQKEDILFWEIFRKKHPEKENEINFAIELLQNMKLNNYTLSPEEKSFILKNLNQKIRHKKRVKTFQLYFSAVASIALLITLFYFYFLPYEKLQVSSMEKKIINTIDNSKDIRLITANNEIMDFEENASIQINKEGAVTVSYGKQKVVSEKISRNSTSLNKLIVPKGRRSSLVLADGTKIWINSGSIVEYPNTFDKKKREISIDGEIYIEVAKNLTQPFIVNTSAFSVNVLGTRFNISAYQEDMVQSVVLVEGSVKVESRQTKQTAILEPDQMLYMSSNVFKSKKVNVYDYISWKDGLLQLRSEPLSQIFNRISRFYDIPIECEPNVQNLTCSGKLILFDSLHNVLRTISNTIPISYTKTCDKIIVHENKIMK